MKVITNHKTIKRNTRIGNYTLLAGLALFAGSIFINVTGFQDVNNIQQWQVWAMYGSMLAGFIVLQVSVYMTNRFGRKPRIDERITAALKGLTKDYTLYHYSTPVNHLLVGPAGIWIIEPYYQRGTIVYEGARWKQKGGGFMLAYLKIFAQEGLGRPDLEVKADLDSLTGALKKTLGDDLPPVNAALVFFDPRAEVQAENAPIPTLKIEQFKEHLRKYAKQNPFTLEQVKRIADTLPKEDEN